MKSTFKVLFYIKRNAQKKDGTMPVVTRITFDGKISQFNTKLLSRNTKKAGTKKKN